MHVTTRNPCIREAAVIAQQLTALPPFHARAASGARFNNNQLRRHLRRVSVRFSEGHVVPREVRRISAWSDPNEHPHFIYLHPSCLSIAERAALDPASALYRRVVFFLAVAILHELVHVADGWFRFRPGAHVIETIDIPGYRANLDAGDLVEIAMFGGTIDGINVPLRSLTEVYILGRVDRTIPEAEIEAFYADATHNPNNIRAPRRSARAVRDLTRHLGPNWND